MNDSRRNTFYKAKNSSFIDKKVIISIILVLLILFFGLQFLSHIFFEIGRGEAGPKNIRLLRWSSILSPCEAKPLLEYGSSLLQKSKQSKDQQLLEKSIKYLEKSTGSNMLYYLGYFYSGKAYDWQTVFDYTSFNLAIAAFKKAALIRGNDLQVSKDTMAILLSYWPFLDDKDKDFCTGLLKKTITRIGSKDFNSLLDTWALKNRDINFFEEALKKKPYFYLLAAEKLLQAEIDKDARHKFLSKYTVYSMAQLEEEYQEYRSEKPVGLLKQLKSIFDRLRKNISIYYLKEPKNKSKQKGYSEFKKRVNLDIIELLLAGSGWQKDSRSKTELESFILTYIKDLNSLDEFKSLSDFLTKKEYFSTLLINKKYLNLRLSDLKALYIQQLIAFKSGQYDSVIFDVEKFRRENPFDRKASPTVYNDILLLLTDAYISSRLLTRANSVLKEVKKGDVNLADFYWRKMIIERVIGPDNDEEDSGQQYQLINDSRFVELASPSLKKTVYFVKNNNIEIRFADALYEEIKSAHLLQVFIDGNLVYENYLGNLVFPVKISIPTEKNYSRHTLSIKIR